ncbi:MAG TPA: hypothetical protein DIT40_08705 [Alphaproteobacteria bacterium]|jgi:hypothetical protein|nr:hypothetical protein [Alphaproteobacteria bacterium]HCO91038.1 hypothetical protein [Alphaproteobacteria bacterium]
MSNTPPDDNFCIITQLDFRRPELNTFLEYWLNKRADRNFPRRSEINPAEFPKLLPWINMYDVLDGGRDFRVRICGTALTEVIGFEVGGKLVSEIDPPIARRIKLTLQAVLEMRAPIRATTSRSALPGQDFQGSEVCALPLSSDGTDIDIIIVASLLDTRK